MSNRNLILLSAAVVLANLAVPVAAQEHKSVTVHYGDLNLATSPGRERLTTRIRMAVKQVCGTPATRDLRVKADIGECKGIAMREADVQLANLFNGKGSALASRGAVVIAAP